MNIDEMIEKMDQIAEAAHKNQFRHDGKTEYITHPRAVADLVEKRLKPIALGHDIPEDTSVTIKMLEKEGFDAYVTDAVDVLTHKDNEPNMVYWKRILTNPDAVIVKLADIKHNLSGNPTEYQQKKYAKALALFKAAGYSV